MGVVADAGPVGSAGTPRAKQDFEHNFDHMVDPEIFFEWLTGYDDRLKSQVATWLWLHHIESDFCSHSHNLCNRDLVNQVAATLTCLRLPVVGHMHVTCACTQESQERSPIVNSARVSSSCSGISFHLT